MKQILTTAIFLIISSTITYSQVYTDQIKIQENPNGSGKLGVNIEDPTEALDINGNIRLRNLSDGFLKVNSNGVLYKQTDNFYLKKVFQYGPEGFNISGSPSGLKILRNAGSNTTHSHYGTYIIVFQFRGLQENFIFSLEKEYNSNFNVSVKRLPGRTTMVNAIVVNNPVQDDYFELQFQPSSSADNDWHTIIVYQLAEGRHSAPTFSRISSSQFGSGTQIVQNNISNTPDQFYYVDGNFGIGVSDPQYDLQIAGLVGASGFVQSSDITLKNIICNITGSEILEKYQKFNLYSFQWKTDSGSDKKNSQNHTGIIAQEVEKVFPEFVTTDNQGYKSVEYSALAITAIEAIKEQQKEIEILKDKMLELEDQVKRINKR